MKYKVVIATRSFGSSSQKPWNILREGQCDVVHEDIASISDEELISILSQADGFIVGARKITAGMMADSRLKVISMHGVGTDHIDLEAAKKHNVIIANCPGANANSVADLTVGLMLALARNIPQASQAVKNGEWGRYAGVEIWSKTLSLFGFGAIGRAVARRAAGFSMSILVYDPFVSQADVEKSGGRICTLDHLFREADFLSLHAPLTSETKYIINHQALIQMKPSAFLLNMARGGLVDESALYEALKQNVIAGAALDAFAREPPIANPLLNLSNVVATPHMGAHSREATTNASIMAARNVVQALQTGEPEHRVV